MALVIGDVNASTGMSKAIFDELKNQLSGGIAPADLQNVEPSWKKLAFAIATGVVNHLKSNMEIQTIKTSGQINADVNNVLKTITVNTDQVAPTSGHVK